MRVQVSGSKTGRRARRRRPRNCWEIQVGLPARFFEGRGVRREAPPVEHGPREVRARGGDDQHPVVELLAGAHVLPEPDRDVVVGGDLAERVLVEVGAGEAEVRVARARVDDLPPLGADGPGAPAPDGAAGERRLLDVPEAPGPVVGEGVLAVQDQDGLLHAPLQEVVAEAQPRAPGAQDRVPVPLRFRAPGRQPLGQRNGSPPPRPGRHGPPGVSASTSRRS